MALSTTTSRVAYSGNGVTTSFSVPFPFILNSDLKVFLVDNTTQAATPYVLDTDYSLTGAGNGSGGTLTVLPVLILGVSTPNPPPTGKRILIFRDVPRTQELSIANSGNFPPSAFELELDKVVMQVQRLADLVSRALTLKDTFTGTFDPSLPNPLPAGAVLTVNPAGNGLTTGPTVTAIQQAIDAAAAAAVSATNAAASESNSAASAASAASASAAAISAVAAVNAQLASILSQLSSQGSAITTNSNSITSLSNSLASLTTTVGLKADTSAMNAALATKADQSSLNTTNANVTANTTAIGTKADQSALNTTNTNVASNTTAITNIQNQIDPAEVSFTLVNNQASPVDVTGLVLPTGKKGMVVAYQIQRITTGGGAVELVETGTMIVTKLSGSSRVTIQASDEDAGVVFTATTTGQVQYTSSNITGTASVSKITFKMRALTA